MSSRARDTTGAQVEIKMPISRAFERWNGIDRCFFSTCSCKRILLQSARHAMTRCVFLQSLRATILNHKCFSATTSSNPTKGLSWRLSSTTRLLVTRHGELLHASGGTYRGCAGKNNLLASTLDREAACL